MRFGLGIVQAHVFVDVDNASVPLEGDGFEPSVPRVIDGDLGRQIPRLIAVFELAGTTVTLQRGTKVIRQDRHPEFP